MGILTISVSLGQLFGLLVGFFTLEDLTHGNWRALILITSIPGLIAWVVAIFYLDESPLFNLTIPDFDSCFKTLK
jgi:MFS family permease